MRVLIVDDEELARRGLALRLEPVSDIEICGYAASGAEAINSIRELRPDLVFLDIQMPGVDGFGVLRALSTQMPLVIFVTAYDQYAIKAFDAYALDYLLKPIDDPRLEEALERARKRLQDGQASRHREALIGLISELTGDSPEALEDVLSGGELDHQSRYLRRLPIKEGGRTLCLNVKEIDWVDAAGDYMCIHAAGTTHVIRGTMKRLETGLNPLTFQRVHRSTIVNVHRVRELRPHMNGEYFLRLDCGNEIKLSRHYKEKLKLFVSQI